MFTLFSAPPSARPSSRRLRPKKPELGVEQLDKRQVLSAAPTVDVPDSFVVEQRQTTPLDFGSTPFADIDSPGSKRMKVTVKAASGTLSASSGSGVRVSGKGATRHFRGTLDNLNNYFSGAGQVSYRNKSEGAYSLSVRIAEKVGRRRLSSTDWAMIHVRSAASGAHVSSSSTVGFPPQLGSTSSTSSLSTSSFTPTTSWSSDSSYPSTTSSWYSYPSSSTTDYFSTAMNSAAANTQSLLNLQSSYNELQSLNSQLSAMSQPTYSMPSSVMSLLPWGSDLIGSSSWSSGTDGADDVYTGSWDGLQGYLQGTINVANGYDWSWNNPSSGMSSSTGTPFPFINWSNMGSFYSGYADQPYNSSYDSTYNSLQDVNSWLTGVYQGFGIYL